MILDERLYLFPGEACFDFRFLSSFQCLFHAAYTASVLQHDHDQSGYQNHQHCDHPGGRFRGLRLTDSLVKGNDIIKFVDVQHI